MRVIKLAVALAVCASLFFFVPRSVFAQDGCGLVQAFLVGCDYDQRERQLEREYQLQQETQAAAAAAAATRAQQQADQLRYQQWLASEQARQELERIAANERVDKERIQAELEMMYARERMAGVQATTSFNVAALQSDAMIAVASARANEAAAQQTVAVLVSLAVVAAASAIVYAARQYRRVAETQAVPRLLPSDPWQRRAVLMLEQRGVPWRLNGNQLLVHLDDEWKIVED